MTGLVREDLAEVDDAKVVELLTLLGSTKFFSLVGLLTERLDDIRIRLEGDDAFASLLELVHQSRGSAASLGFPRAAVALEEVERLLDPGYDDGRNLGQSERRSAGIAILGALLNAFLTSCEKIDGMPCRSILPRPMPGIDVV